MFICESSYLGSILNGDNLCPDAFSDKKSWDNIESRKMTDWSSQKKETTYPKCNYIIKDIKNGSMGRAFPWWKRGLSGEVMKQGPYTSEFTLELQRKINTLEKGPARVFLLRANAAWFRERGGPSLIIC